MLSFGPHSLRLGRICLVAVMVALFVPSVSSPPALAVKPSEILSDPQLEARARELSKLVRCLVCQNESIDESNADMAADLRVLLRERLVAGDSDEQVLDYLIARYGDFVLLKPRFQPSTYALYLGPPIVLLLGVLVVLLYLRGRRRQLALAGQSGVMTELTDDERARVQAVMERRGDS